MKDEQLLELIRTHQPLSIRQEIELIIRLSLPSMLAQLSTIMMFYIDASMVGSLGAKASASVALVTSTLWVFGGLTAAVAMGFAVQVAHFVGASDEYSARKVLRQAYVCATLCALILSSIGVFISTPLPHWLGGAPEICEDGSKYFLIFAISLPFMQLNFLSGAMLRCSGNMKIPSLVNILMCIFDVFFNFILSSAIMTFFAAIKSPKLSLLKEKESFKPQKEIVVKAIKIGVPIALQHLAISLAQIISTMIVAPLGIIALSAHSFAITVESICYMPGNGISEAATTLVGQSIGAKRPKLTFAFAKISVAVGVFVMSIAGILMYVFAPELLSIMTPVKEIQDLAVGILRIEAFAEPLCAVAIVSYGVFVGAGDTFAPSLMNFFSMWGVRLTSAYLMAPHFGLYGVWIAMCGELCFRGLIFLIRLLKGSWLKKALPKKMEIKEEVTA